MGCVVSIRERPRKDGTKGYAVLYTSPGGRQTSATFTDRPSAEVFQHMVEVHGAVRAQEMAGVRDTVRSRPTGMTVQDWLNHYIDHLTGVTKTTLYDYRAYLRNDIAPVLGQIPLTELSSDELRVWLHGMIRTGMVNRNGDRVRDASGKTLRNKFTFLASALNEAVRQRRIDYNPASGIRLPETERPDMVFLSRPDFARLLEATPQRWRTMVEFLAATGARFGEVTALRPVDVDRVNGTVNIHRAWKRTYEAGGYELGPPKTKRSRRTISVDRDLLDRLDYSRDWLFTNKRGGPVRLSYFRASAWVPAVEGLDPRPRIHDLRHTHASWLIQDKVPLVVVQRRLGHESVRITGDVYSHIDRSDDETAAAVYRNRRTEA